MGNKKEMRTVFWYVTPRSLLQIYQRVGRTYCLRLQGRKITGLGACLVEMVLINILQVIIH